MEKILHLIFILFILSVSSQSIIVKPLDIYQLAQQFQNASLITNSTCKTLKLQSREIHLLNVPDIMQATNYTCGPASVIAVLNYYGVWSYREMQFADLALTLPGKGTGPQNIVKALSQINIIANIHENISVQDLQDFIDEKKPVIVLIQAWRKGQYTKQMVNGHYVVMMGYDREYLYFEDPAMSGSVGYIPRNKFEERWRDKIYSESRNYYNTGIVLTHKINQKPVIRQLL